MELLKAAFLGLVEGVTEFLPVSSTGHLILAGQWIGFTGERAKTFEIFIQLGAILAVVWLYRVKIFLWNRSGSNATSLRLCLNVLIAFLPAAIAGLLFHDFVKNVLFRPSVVAASLIIGGILIFVIEGLVKRRADHGSLDLGMRPSIRDDVTDGASLNRIDVLEKISARKAFGVGMAQILALIPGVSRSGATILGGMVFGMSRVVATEFSFFLAIPTMFAATIYDLWKSVSGLPGGGILPGEVLPASAMLGEISSILSTADVPIFAAGFLVSFLSALIVIKFFLRFVSTHTFRLFAWYRIAIGATVFLVF